MAGRIMQAVQYSGYGGGAAALKRAEIGIPSTKRDELLLKVEAVSINPVDWKIQSGLFRPILPPHFPFVPVTDVTGEITELGPGVDGFNLGDKVVSKIPTTRSGGLAEYAVVPANLTVHRPPQVTAAQAAGLPIAAMTALQALKRITTKFDGTGAPANVLVTAASGGVGTYAVQLAKLANLHVTATCGSRNADLVKTLGADEVLDYRTPEGKSLRSPSGRRYDLVVHCTTGIDWETFERNLADGGEVVDLTPGLRGYAVSALKRLTLSKKRLTPLLLAANKEDLGLLVELVKEGQIRTVVESVHAFSDAAAAWARSMEGRATGKIIVEMQG